MDITSPRKLVEVGPEWSTTQIVDSISLALTGVGPALVFGPSRITSVSADIAVVIPTSGSTGNPKLVALTADALVASAEAAHLFLGAACGEHWSLMLPAHHIAGVNVIVRSILLKSELIDFRSDLSQEFEYTSVVPTQLFRALNGDDVLKASLAAAKAVLVGGAATDQELLQQSREAGINVITTYGMSEMCGGCIYNNVPLPGIEVKIVDGGTIALRGVTQAKEYLGNPTPLTDSEGWFITSDAGYIESGRVFVTGRIDDQIITGGEKLSLASVDKFLTDTFGFEFMSCSLAHPEWGQSLCIATSGDIKVEVVRDALQSHFGRYASPKKFLSEVDLPHTTIGKPDRLALSKRFEMMDQ